MEISLQRTPGRRCLVGLADNPPNGAGIAKFEGLA